MTKKDKEKLITGMIQSNTIRKLYDDYIIKEIPYETWVRNSVDRLLKHNNIPIVSEDSLARNQSQRP